MKIAIIGKYTEEIEESFKHTLNGHSLVFIRTGQPVFNKEFFKELPDDADYTVCVSGKDMNDTLLGSLLVFRGTEDPDGTVLFTDLQESGSSELATGTDVLKFLCRTLGVRTTSNMKSLKELVVEREY